MIHETAIITGDVLIHETATVEPYAVITGPVRIGADAYIGAHAVIGAPGQHHGTYPAPVTGKHRNFGVVIGAGACVREFCSVHQGLRCVTRIGKDSLIMAGCHIAHDCQIGNRVTAATYLTLGGFTFIGDDVTFGQGVITHPWVVIGEGAMVGLNSSVLRDVDPFAKVAGAPVRSLGLNTNKLGDTGVISEEVWVRHAEMVEERNMLKEDWYR